MKESTNEEATHQQYTNKLISRLHQKFPSSQKTTLKADGAFISLRFDSFVFSVDQRMPDAVGCLFKEAMHMADALRKHVRRPYELEEMKKYEQFKEAMIRQEKNAMQSAIVSEKANLLTATGQECKRLRPGSLIEGQYDTDKPGSGVETGVRTGTRGERDSMKELLSILDLSSAFQDGEKARGEVALSSERDLVVLGNSIGGTLEAAVEENLIVGNDSVRDSLIDNIRDNIDYGVRDSIDYGVDYGVRDNIDFSLDGIVRDSIDYGVRDSVDDSLVNNTNDSIDDSLVNNMTVNSTVPNPSDSVTITDIDRFETPGQPSSTLSRFTKKATKLIYNGLNGIKSTEKTKARRNRRKRARLNKTVQFDADISMMEVSTAGNAIDFNMSDILGSRDSTLLRDSSNIANCSTITSQSPISGSRDDIKGIYRDMSSTGRLSSEKADTSLVDSDVQDLRSASSIGDLSSTVLNPKSLNLAPQRQSLTSKADKSIDETLQEHSQGLSALFSNADDFTSGFIFKKAKPEPDRSSAPATEANTPVSASVSPQPSPMDLAVEENEIRSQFGRNDTSLFKQIILDCKDLNYGSTETIRRFCRAYGVEYPEYETVRENDVFRCTATFLDINFVSGYEYDKRDAKDGACKKVIEYVSRNWRSLFIS